MNKNLTHNESSLNTGGKKGKKWKKENSHTIGIDYISC